MKPGPTILFIADPRRTTTIEAAILRGQLLTEGERKNVARLVGADQQHDRVVAWSLVRLGLSRSFPVRPQEWVFSRREDQRPFVVAPPGLPPFQFSLSHTCGRVALLVTTAALGGVDVERMERTADLPLVAPRICAPSELASLNRLSGEAWQKRFFELWTLKEAYAKARAPGPPLNWSDVAFEINPWQEVTVQFAPPVADQPAGWQFWLHRLTVKHMLATAVRDGAAGEISQLILQHVGIRAAERSAWMETLGEGPTTRSPV